MTFTPALAAKIAEQNADALRKQLDALTNYTPKMYDRLVRAGLAGKALAYKDLQFATRRILKNQAMAQLASGVVDDKAFESLQADLDVINQYGSEFATEVQFAAQDAAAIALWERLKVVYAIDGGLLDELGDTADDTFVPAGLWGRLGHPDPFVALPEAIVLPIPEEGLVQYVDGFWITGSREVAPGKFIGQSTHGPVGGSHISLLISARVMHPDGRPFKSHDGRGDMNWTRLTLPSGCTVGDMIAATLNRFTSTSDNIEWRTDVPILVRKLVSVLVYLCASNADMVAQPTPPVRRGKGGGKPYRAPRVIATGFRVGAALKAYRSTPAGAERGPKTGRTVAPHIRRAHFQSFRVGPGRPNERTETLIKWIAPILVKMDTADKPSVHEVKRSKRNA